MYNNIYMVAGDRSQGKTPFILGGDFEIGLANIYLKKGMSTLIIDDYDHPKYRHIPILHPNDYAKLSTHPGIYRTIVPMQHMQKFFVHLLKVWNTLIVFEDCYKYIPAKLSKQLMAILGNSKNQNNCLAFMNWCWGLMQTDIIRLTNYFIIFKTSDSPEVRKTFLSGCYEECMEAYRKLLKGIKGIGGVPYHIVHRRM